MKRILADLSVFGTLDSGGIWNSTLEILNGLLKAPVPDEAPRFEVLFLVRSGNREALKALFPRCRIYTLPSSAVERAEENWDRSGCRQRSALYAPYIRRLRPDVVWLPYAAPYHFYRSPVRTVFTVHDILPLHEAGDNAALCAEYRAMVQAPDRIVTVSQFVRDDLIKTLGVPEQRIQTVYAPIAVHPENQEPLPELSGIPYILEMNSYEPRKNKQTVLNAFLRVSRQFDHHLVFCGAYAEDRAVRPLKISAALMGLGSRVHILYKVSDAQKNWLLQNASLFVSASVGEGFGRTPVEAALYEIPVITSGTDPLPEATRGLVNYLDDPHDAVALAEKMAALLQSPPDRTELTRIRTVLEEAYSPSRASRSYLHALLDWPSKSAKQEYEKRSVSGAAQG